MNLVFFKAVRSKTKFWQMVGRGTRLCKDLFAPGDDKKNFYIFDFCQNLEYFSQNPDGAEGSNTEPLSARLFKTRLEIIGEIRQKLEDETPTELGSDTDALYAAGLTLKKVHDDFVAHLHETVQGMNVDNFIVRPHRQVVDKFAKPEAWQSLTEEDKHDLSNEVAKLPSALLDDDEDAKRFDLLLLKTQLTILQAGTEFSSLKQKIQAIASALEEHESIPAIKAEIVLIQSIASEEWWEGVTVTALEQVRRKLRRLVKLIPKVQKKIVYTNFEDEIGEASTINLPEVTAGLDMAKFKEKARQFLKQHESHLALQRLKRNQPLTKTDLEELEKMLTAAGGSAPLIKAAAEKSHGLGLFVRSLVGLDREAAMGAFSEFIKDGQATANQIEFIEMVVSELVQNGIVEPSRLFESPYIAFNSQGPVGVFPPESVKKMFAVLEQIKHGANAA